MSISAIAPANESLDLLAKRGDRELAVSYALNTASDLGSGAVSASLARLPDFERTSEGVTAPDLQISIREPTAFRESIIEEAFGFRPRLHVSFRLHNLGDGEAALDRILRATSALLRETSADISLLFNGEEVVLTRLQGRLLLNTRPGFWTDARVKMMPEPNAFTEPRLL